MANANYLEFETARGRAESSRRQWRRSITSANLALLKTDETDFLKPFQPLELTVATVGDSLSVWQLENNGDLLVTNGPMTTAEVDALPDR